MYPEKTNFDSLNRETREYRNRCVDRFNASTPNTYSSQWWANYQNNQTYRTNNGQYSRKYY